MLVGTQYKSGLKLQNAATGTSNGTAIDCTEAGNGSFEYLTLQIAGITTATITFEATVDGTNWVAIQATNLNSGSAATTAAADGMFRATVRGLLQFRARISAYTSGTITVTGIATG